MAKVLRLINQFYGGIQTAEKSKVIGAASNVEEVDIFSNENYIQPEQIFTADSLPASTEAYAYDAGPDDTVYAYGKETSGNKVRLLSVSTGGADDPGSFATLFTSADTTNLATTLSDIKFHRTSESPTDYLYYVAGASSTWVLKRYNISGASEATVGTLTGLDGSFDRPWLLSLYGELYIGNGRYIAHVDDDGTFTEKKFTLPVGWEGVGAVGLSDSMLILCRNTNRLINTSMVYQWDLIRANKFDDAVNIPFGGPQWIVNHKEAIRICCAINGTARLYQLSGSFPVETHRLSNIGVETSTQPISSQKNISQKNGILYFGLFKTDKSGVYALGQVDESKPVALVLSKRYGTSDYSLHKPTGLFIQGPNFYAAYVSNGTASTARCEGNNSPSRSSNAVYETIVLDENDPSRNKFIQNITLLTQPLVASTSLALALASDYGAYSNVTAPNSSFSTTGGLAGYFTPGIADKKVFKMKISFTSSGTSGVKLTGIIYLLDMVNHPAFN